MKSKKHKMVRFPGGMNYRGYCIYQDGPRWYFERDECFEGDLTNRVYVSLKGFRELVDEYCAALVAAAEEGGDGAGMSGGM